MRELLERAGFVVRGRRADCHCPGTAKGTISFTDEVAYCHRCHWSANAVQLARSLGQTIPQETKEHRAERLRAERFKRWLSEKYQAAADKERRLARTAELAKDVLAKFPDYELAWHALARWYHKRKRLEDFCESAQCNAGRAVLLEGWLEKEDKFRQVSGRTPRAEKMALWGSA
jgi:hypothetical protein